MPFCVSSYTKTSYTINSTFGWRAQYQNSMGLIDIANMLYRWRLRNPCSREITKSLQYMAPAARTTGLQISRTSLCPLLTKILPWPMFPLFLTTGQTPDIAHVAGTFSRASLWGMVPYSILDHLKRCLQVGSCAPCSKQWASQALRLHSRLPYILLIWACLIDWEPPPRLRNYLGVEAVLVRISSVFIPASRNRTLLYKILAITPFLCCLWLFFGRHNISQSQRWSWLFWEYWQTQCSIT